MREMPDQPLSMKVLTVWRIVLSMEWILFSLVFISYFFLSKYVPFLPEWLFTPLLILYLLLSINSVIFIPKLKWERWRYKIYDNEVELMYGVFVRKRTIIPMIRVQHVDTKQGPILRHYKLSTVTVSTAATTHEIPGLEEWKANELRDHIAELAREADPDD